MNDSPLTPRMSQCGGYSTTVDRFKSQIKIVFFCGTSAVANLKVVIKVGQEEFDKLCEELILNHTCSGRPTGVLGLLPDVR